VPGVVIEPGLTLEVAIDNLLREFRIGRMIPVRYWLVQLSAIRAGQLAAQELNPSLRGDGVVKRSAPRKKAAPRKSTPRKR
jgi:hypothetical protein